MTASAMAYQRINESGESGVSKAASAENGGENISMWRNVWRMTIMRNRSAVARHRNINIKRRRKPGKLASIVAVSAILVAIWPIAKWRMAISYAVAAIIKRNQ